MLLGRLYKHLNVGLKLKYLQTVLPVEGKAPVERVKRVDLAITRAWFPVLSAMVLCGDSYGEGW